MVCSYVVVRHIPRGIIKAFGALRLLVLAKPSSGIQLVIINEVLY